MAEKNMKISEVAKNQRYIALIQKMKSGKALKPNEIKEVEGFEKVRMAKKANKKSQFTIKQQRFIDCFDGDIKKAAKKAGISYDYGRQLYTKSHILEAIRNRQDTEVRPQAIATRQQRQEFWTKTMNSEVEDMKDRLRASELLGKSEADFTENVKHLGVIQNLNANMTPKQRLEALREALNK